MTATDPLRAALEELITDWKLDEEAVRRGSFPANEASIAGCRNELEKLLAAYPAPTTHTEYAVKDQSGIFWAMEPTH